MNKAILRPEVQNFISEFKGSITKLALKGSPWEDITIQEILQQIEGHQKCKEKLPTWYNTKCIYYPPKVNLEQTSSEITAQYKASLLNGKTLADLTGGFGVDTYYFAEKFQSVFHFEKNGELSEITKHNFKQFQKSNVQFFPEDGINGIHDQHFEVIFIDPSRRHSSKGKVFFLKDCEPNVVEHLDYLLTHCNTLLLKTSPMLDIAVGLGELKNVSEIHIVAVQNEVKELLWILSKNENEPLLVTTINFSKTTIEKFQFYGNERPLCHYHSPLTYLYEPNAAIMKSGGFANLCEVYKVYKLALHSHLYTSEQLQDFPGRKFKVIHITAYSKSNMKRFLNTKANITTRNFTETVSQLRKKWKIVEGGAVYLFFTSLADNEKVVITCEKITNELL